MRNTNTFADILDALSIILRQEHESAAEEHEPHQSRYKTEDVIERQERQIMYIEFGIVLDRLIRSYDLLAHFNLKAYSLAAVGYYLGL